MSELDLSGDYLLGPAEALAAQERNLQGCRRCKLCEQRNTIVFGSGSPRAELVVIGEGPGADEDAQGKPSPRCWSRCSSRATRCTSRTR